MKIDSAMVLAAGLGTRLRPITDTMPKPLVPIAGKPMIDYVLDALEEAGVEEAVVNVHHLADQMEQHLARRKRPKVQISDERAQLMDSGAGFALLTTMVRAFEEQGIRTVFEGIEEGWQLDLAEKSGASMVQGFVLARPELAPTSFRVFADVEAPVAIAPPNEPFPSPSPASPMRPARTFGRRTAS